MLNQRPHNIPALFGPSSILDQSFHNPLLDLLTALTLCVCYFDQALKHALDGQGLWLLERQALPLLGLERHITSIAILIVQLPQSRIV